ncbi:hypothetical protein [Pseudoalteromonas sp. T1lg10]|uniref:hypothetical protein n=1 Tax=Pseudoalteromonas sp. T1lg10 TaxID=2077093 RepID=UPI000CF63D32|nr:hypothetical protein [Pseudoalteromonas sp. T1lg10]
MEREPVNYNKLYLVVFLAVLSVSLLLLAIFAYVKHETQKQELKQLEQLFSTPTYQSTSLTFEQQVQKRMEELKPEFDHRQKIKIVFEDTLNSVESNPDINGLSANGSSMCKTYYDLYEKEPTKQNMEIARQVCANFK